jgi:NAD(P)-dependent dehydrogenase (short-subunit alcohol dehydrogenase family)
MKVVVVGASSGLGRSIGVGLGRQGDRVALLARRVDRLEDAAREAGAGALAISCDVTDEKACQRAVDEAAEGLGGIDGLVYAPAVGPLLPIADVSAETWRQVFDTNVIGASLITAAALPHLRESRGVAAYLSSVGGSHTPPWPGLGAYTVSKAALERLIEAWRVEHPSVGFCRVVIGDTAGGDGPNTTEFADEWDTDLAAELMPHWLERGLMVGSLLEVDEIVRVVSAVLGTGAGATIPSVVITPRPPLGPPLENA